MDYYEAQRDAVMRFKQQAVQAESKGNSPEARRWWALYVEAYDRVMSNLRAAGFSPSVQREEGVRTPAYESLEKAWREMNESVERGTVRRLRPPSP